MASRPNSKKDCGFEKLSPRLERIHGQPDAGTANATVTGLHGANASTVRRVYVARYAPDFYEEAAHATGEALVDVFVRAWNAAHKVGRPEIGPVVNVRMPEEMLDRLDSARHEGESRAAAIRRLLADALS